MSSQTSSNGDVSSKLLGVGLPTDKSGKSGTMNTTHRPFPSLPRHHPSQQTRIKSYPVVHDSLETLKSHPVGQKSIDLTQTGYNKFVAPVFPYVRGPYSYVAPYVAKADSLASDGLSKVDQTFPLVKEDTQTIKGTLLDYAYFPFRFANDGKNYVLDTYGSEYKKCGGDGYVSGGKALITTGMVVTSDTLVWLSSFFGAKKQQGQDYAGAQYKKGREYAHQTSAYVHDKTGEAMRYAQDQSQHAKHTAYQKTDDAIKYGQERSEQAKQTAYQTTDDAAKYGQQKTQHGKDMVYQTTDEAKGKGQEVKGKAQETKKTAQDKAKA
ncbi:MAG: hypothetical protein Q9163_005785 [Psora crenata]